MTNQLPTKDPQLRFSGGQVEGALDVHGCELCDQVLEHEWQRNSRHVMSGLARAACDLTKKALFCPCQNHINPLIVDASHPLLACLNPSLVQISLIVTSML